MTTRQDIARWAVRGVKEGCTHMLVVCDTFDYEDYPVYVKPGEVLEDVYKEYDRKNMQKVMEVYDLNKYNPNAGGT